VRSERIGWFLKEAALVGWLLHLVATVSYQRDHPNREFTPRATGLISLVGPARRCNWKIPAPPFAGCVVRTAGSAEDTKFRKIALLFGDFPSE
jgi:hypothetical protein